MQNAQNLCALIHMHATFWVNKAKDGIALVTVCIVMINDAI